MRVNWSDSKKNSLIFLKPKASLFLFGCWVIVETKVILEQDALTVPPNTARLCGMDKHHSSTVLNSLNLLLVYSKDVNEANIILLYRTN